MIHWGDWVDMASIQNITFACAEPDELAAFWADTLEYDLEPIPPALADALEATGRDPSDGRAIFDPSGDGPRLFFKRMPKSATEHIPIHLDLEVPDREAAVATFVENGATEVETKTLDLGEHEQVWTVMNDPEGNGFCVAESSN